MFCLASICQRYSFPIRRAGSPLQHSSWPRIANLTLRGLHDARERDRDLLRAVVEGAHAADPEEDLRASPRFAASSAIVGMSSPSAHFARSRRREGPRAAALLHRFEHRLHLGGEPRLHEHEVAPQVHDRVEVLDPHRALVHAGAAGGAGPELLFGDEVVEQPVLRSPPRARPPSADVRRLLHQPLPRVDDDLARREQLSGEVRRAHARCSARTRCRSSRRRGPSRRAGPRPPRRTARRPRPRGRGRG